jgi:hypothetical protein
MYRPQFPFPVPDQFQDKDFVHYFDQTNTPRLNDALSLAAGATIIGIPLQLQGDAPFNLRAIEINGPNNYAVRLRDPYGNYLSDDYIPIPLDYGPEETAGYGSNVVEFEPELKCPAGSVILVDVKRVS